MSLNDGWTGPRDGPFRGDHLQWCRAHSGFWTRSKPCPACQLETQLRALKAEKACQCADCRKPGPVNGTGVTP